MSKRVSKIAFNLDTTRQSVRLVIKVKKEGKDQESINIQGNIKHKRAKRSSHESINGL